MSQPTIDAPPAPKAPRSSNPVLRFFKRLLLTALFLALAGMILFLLSERHSRLFKLDLNEAGALVVLRGRTLPVGFTPWTPQDLQLAQTYAPFELDEAARAGLDLTHVYAERDALDRVLFDLHREAIEQRAGNADAQTLDEVVRLLRRAERLPGLSDEQKRLLRDLQIRTAYFEGRQRLEEASALLQKALSKLRLATEGEDGRYVAAAESLLLRMEGSAKQLMNAAAQGNPAELTNGADRPADSAHVRARLAAPPAIPEKSPAPDVPPAVAANTAEIAGPKGTAEAGAAPEPLPTPDSAALTPSAAPSAEVPVPADVGQGG